MQRHIKLSVQKKNRRMAFKYFPHTDEDIKLMLDKIGVQRLEDLYADVPENVRLKTTTSCLKLLVRWNYANGLKKLPCSTNP